MNIDIPNWHALPRLYFAVCIPATSVRMNDYLALLATSLNKTRSSLELNTVNMLARLRSWLSDNI